MSKLPSFVEALSTLYSITRSNVPLVSLRATKDGEAVRISSYGRPVGDFRCMIAGASVEGVTGVESEPVVVSMPLLLAACGLLTRGSARKKQTPPHVSIKVGDDRALRVTRKGGATTAIPMLPYQIDDDQYSVLTDQMTSTKNGWDKLPLDRVLEAADSFPANKLKISDDFANSRSRASLIIQKIDGLATASISSNFSLFTRVMSKAGKSVLARPAMLSMICMAMVRTLATDAKSAENTALLADNNGTNLLLTRKDIDAHILLRMAPPAQGSPSPADISQLFKSIMASIDDVPEGKRNAAAECGALREAITETAMFADAGDALDPPIVIDKGKSDTGKFNLLLSANKDSRTSAIRRIPISGLGASLFWKGSKPVNVSSAGLMMILTAIPNTDRVMLYPSRAGNSLFVLHRAVEGGKAGKILSVAALVARSTGE